MIDKALPSQKHLQVEVVSSQIYQQQAQLIQSLPTTTAKKQVDYTGAETLNSILQSYKFLFKKEEGSMRGIYCEQCERNMYIKYCDLEIKYTLNNPSRIETRVASAAAENPAL